jgi:hypothetical protein
MMRHFVDQRASYASLASFFHFVQKICQQSGRRFHHDNGNAHVHQRRASPTHQHAAAAASAAAYSPPLERHFNGLNQER